MNAQLNNWTRQLLAYSELKRLDRVREADVRFTFREDSLYLRLFGAAYQRLASGAAVPTDPLLLRCAEAFSHLARIARSGNRGLNADTVALQSAALYWLAGYSANAAVLAREVSKRKALSPAERILVMLLSRTAFNGIPDRATPTEEAVRRYVRAGRPQDLGLALDYANRAVEESLTAGDARVLAGAYFLRAVLQKYEEVSIWGAVKEHASAGLADWQRYAADQVARGKAIVDLWPSQRAAIESGLLDSRSSIVLRMPTSAGKTKLTELAFVNDLASGVEKCLYIAPFRALVTEIEEAVGGTLARLGYPVASLYGNADANELEVRLAETARVVIATPEKIAAVQRLAGTSLGQFGTIVIDEGHLLGDGVRGAAFELQLASLKAKALNRRFPDGESASDAGATANQRSPRLVFLSAVLPNASELAGWLGGGASALAATDWHPTTTRVGVLSWPAEKAAQLEYVVQSEDEGRLFVPRVFDEKIWTAINPETGRLRTHRFPVRSNKASIAAAMALRYVGLGPVIVFAQQPRWAAAIAEQLMGVADQPPEAGSDRILPTKDPQELETICRFVDAKLGADSLVARALRRRVGVHHGHVPQSVRLVIEQAFRDRVVQVLVATSTIAQGVNFPARTVLIHSLPRSDSSVRDFWNLAGRAGRALHETVGDVIVLQESSEASIALKRVLDRSRLEPARSQILRLVERMLLESGNVSSEAIRRLVGEDEDAALWRGLLDVIDSSILDALVEDDASVNPGAFQALVDSLLATHEANVSESSRPGRVEAVGQLFRLRRAAVLEAVPEGASRLRFAKSGLPVALAKSLDTVVSAVRAAFPASRAFDEQSFGDVVAAVLGARGDGQGGDSNLARLGFRWVSTGSYRDVLDQSRGALESVDEAVEFVEDELAYQLSWELAGLVRLLEATQDAEVDVAQKTKPSPAEDVPAWLRLLPAYLRYGVNTPELVWALSGGLQDRELGQWVLLQFSNANGRSPKSYREIFDWSLSSRTQLSEAASGVWPEYFRRVLGASLDRYAKLSTMFG